LVEVLVAMSAGVLVSMAAFALSRNATHFFQHEARISATQLALTLGMNRITSDIQRASLMSTPNIQWDRKVCRDVSWPAGLTRLAGVTIAASTSPSPQSLANGFTPDKLTLGGSFDTSEWFGVQIVEVGNAGAPALTLMSPTVDTAMARVLASANAGQGETLATKLTPIFVGGRFLRIFDPVNDVYNYGVIDNFTVTGNIVKVQLKAVPTIPQKPASPCGIQMPMAGGQLRVSVVSRVVYDIRSLAAVGGSYGTLVAPITPAVTGDNGRTELVRVELDETGAEIPGTLEMVAEYAVDLRFGLTVATRITNSNANYAPTVQTFPLGSAQIYTVAGDVTGTGSPELIRSMQVRLATRARAPDREADLPAGPDGRRLRFLVDPALARPQFARVRTNYAHVAMPNQGGFSL
jgi:hypothetical protein